MRTDRLSLQPPPLPNIFSPSIAVEVAAPSRDMSFPVSSRREPTSSSREPVRPAAPLKGSGPGDATAPNNTPFADADTAASPMMASP